MQTILVISNCRLGDALVMIPALRSLKALPARITLASEAAAPGIVAAEDILGYRGLVDCFVKMSISGGFFARLLDRLRFFTRMRREKWDLGIVLMPPCPPLTMRLVKRLCTYLRLCGCRQIIAPQCIQANMQVADMMLALLSQNGIAPIADGSLSKLAKSTPNPLPNGKKYIAVAPGANMPVNCWALDNYATVLKAVTTKYNYTPVYFSGENERTICERLNEKVPGHTIIGRPLPEVECAMRQCHAYLGNDTGLIHLAAALGLPCIGIYSNRNPRSIWEPYMPQKLIFYPEDCDCAGCLKTQCDKMCINQTTPQKVLSAIDASAFLQ